MKIGDKVKVIYAQGSYSRYNGSEGIVSEINRINMLNATYDTEIIINNEKLSFYSSELVVITEKPAPLQFGMKATVITNDGTVRIYRNLTEVHYNPPPSFEIVAFESDIHGTGYTIDKSKIRDIEITLETKIAKSI